MLGAVPITVTVETVRAAGGVGGGIDAAVGVELLHADNVTEMSTVMLREQDHRYMCLPDV